MCLLPCLQPWHCPCSCPSCLALPWHLGLLGFLRSWIFILLVLSCIVLSGCVVSYPHRHGTWPNLVSSNLDFMVELLLKEMITVFTHTEISAYLGTHNSNSSALDAICRMQVCPFKVQTGWDRRPFILFPSFSSSHPKALMPPDTWKFAGFSEQTQTTESYEGWN